MRAGDAQAHRAQDGSAEREGGHLPGATEDRGAFSKARKPEARPLAQPATLVGEEGRFHRPQPSLGASPQPAGPHASWALTACRPSVPRSPPRPRAPRPPWAGLPGAGGAGGRPRCPPGGRGKCYFCLLLSSGTGSPGRGPEQPLRLGPAHREFLKDARGCREGGRRGRGGWAGPPNPPPKKEGAGRMRGGGGGGGGRPSAWPLSASPRGRRERPAQAPAGPADGRAAPAPCCSRPPAQALRGAGTPGPALSSIEAALFPRRANQRPVPGCFPVGGEGAPTPALPGVLGVTLF